MHFPERYNIRLKVDGTFVMANFSPLSHPKKAQTTDTPEAKRNFAAPQASRFWDLAAILSMDVFDPSARA